MATVTTTAPQLTRVVAAPSSEAGEHYRVGRETAIRASRFPAERQLNMRFFGGRTIEQLAFTHVPRGSPRLHRRGGAGQPGAPTTWRRSTGRCRRRWPTGS